jgi:hypothetical protein
MVGPSPPDPAEESSGRARDRAQLLLVGSVAFAVVIIGLVVVINTVLFTENLQTGDALDRSEEVAHVNYEAQSDVSSLVLRINHNHRNATAGQLASAVKANVSRYSLVLSELYGERGSAVVNITYDNATSTTGTRIVQSARTDVESPSGSVNWFPIDESDRRDVGRFVLSANVEDSSIQRFHVNITNASDDYVRFSMNRTVGGDPDLRIETERSYAAGSTVECDPSANLVLLDLLEGRQFTGGPSGCEFAATEGLEGPYSIEYRRGDRINASYGFVFEERLKRYGSGPYPACTASVPRTEVCHASAIWTANVTIHYDAGSIRYTQPHNVSVYP